MAKVIKRSDTDTPIPLGTKLFHIPPFNLLRDETRKHVSSPSFNLTGDPGEKRASKHPVIVARCHAKGFIEVVVALLNS